MYVSWVNILRRTGPELQVPLLGLHANPCVCPLAMSLCLDLVWSFSGSSWSHHAPGLVMAWLGCYTVMLGLHPWHDLTCCYDITVARDNQEYNRIVFTTFWAFAYESAWAYLLVIITSLGSKPFVKLLEVYAIFDFGSSFLFVSEGLVVRTYISI